MNFHYSLAKGCRNTELFWKLINSRPSAGEARLAPKFGRTFLRVTKSDPLSRRARKKGRETTTGCFHRRILAVQLPPCLWENWRWLVRPVPLVVATFSSVLVWLLGNIGKVMSCFFFLVLFGGVDCMFQTVCITVILFLQIFAANQDCIQQVPHECGAFSLRQSNDSYAHVDDHTVVVGALYCRTFPLPNHGKS